MLSYYMTVDDRITRVEHIEPGCWINMIYPTDDELLTVNEELGIDMQFLRAALDEEETSHIDTEDGQTLIIIDIPYVEKGDTTKYSTQPLGIIVTDENIVTVCLKENPIIEGFTGGRVKGIKTSQKTRLILLMLYRFAGQFLQYLKQIDKVSGYVERQLYKSQRNKELIQLLELEKSLVYFSTSLKADEATLEKIYKGRIIKLYEDDQDLLEDVLVEVRQAIEMANIYSSILSGMMDAYASIISNNQNVIMKLLTSITILITVPNIVFSYYGMNVSGLPLPYSWFPIVLSLGIVVVTGIILKKRDLF